MVEFSVVEKNKGPLRGQ